MFRIFARHRGAATAVEFALILPMFAYMVLMTLQAGLYFYYTATLQRGADAAVRQILVGNAANASLTKAQFVQNDLCPQVLSLTCANIVVNFIAAPNSFYSLTNKTANPNVPLGYSLTGLTMPAMNNAKTSYYLASDRFVMVAQISTRCRSSAFPPSPPRPP